MAKEHQQTQGHGHGDGHDTGHAHSPYLHHHFETPVQQFESDKLGMWLFLATEILMFGAYSVWRHNHPEVFMYAHVHLNKVLGASNTVVLIFSSFTMAWSIKAIQEGKKMLCAALLVITLLCAATFMVIKYFEYAAKIEHGLLWGKRYQPHHEAEGHSAADAAAIGGAHSEAAVEETHSVEPDAVPESHEMAASIAEKRTPMPVQDQPTIGISEDPGDTQISDKDVEHATSQAEHSAEISEHTTPAVTVHGKATEAGTATTALPLVSGSTQVAVTANPPGVIATPTPSSYAYPSGLKLEPTKINPAALPPAGLAADSEAALDEHGPEPKNVQTFFAIYFAMTGLHGIHVLAGMIAITVMLVMVLRGKYNSEYWTPIDLTGLFWHVVDLIWIFLFPLLYLIA
ncbi:MAG: cytochrome c oxidase subunit 3 [bacterium]|nr:cytochrome c oxidase subunit 3 [bacterium]